jgi:thioredoxin reductase
MYDVIIVGGGPAGLSAALLLGRCRRRVLLCDAGRPRNAASHAVHAFLSRDGTPPSELFRFAREQLQPYDVEVLDLTVTDARRDERGFTLTLEDGAALRCRKLLLATGVRDCLPELEGLEALYGTSVFHCPYCDGWEARDQPIAAYGRGNHGAQLGLSLLTWSRDIVVLTGGQGRVTARMRERLARHGVGLRERKILRLCGAAGRLEHVELEDGERLERRVMFFATGYVQHSDLARRLGSHMTRKGLVRTNKLTLTEVPGLYVVGDAACEVKLAIIAAADGAKAAFAVNRALQDEDFQAHESET